MRHQKIEFSYNQCFIMREMIIKAMQQGELLNCEDLRIRRTTKLKSILKLIEEAMNAMDDRRQKHVKAVVDKIKKNAQTKAS